MKTQLCAEIEQLDFSKATESASTINKWVEDTTRGKITDLITPGKNNKS